MSVMWVYIRIEGYLPFRFFFSFFLVRPRTACPRDRALVSDFDLHGSRFALFLYFCSSRGLKGEWETSEGVGGDLGFLSGDWLWITGDQSRGSSCGNEAVGKNKNKKKHVP